LVIKKTENDFKTNREVEERKLHQMANAHCLLEIWQGLQNLPALQMGSRSQNKQMKSVGYILYTEKIVNASSSNIQYDCVTAFKLSK